MTDDAERLDELKAKHKALRGYRDEYNGAELLSIARRLLKERDESREKVSQWEEDSKKQK